MSDTTDFLIDWSLEDQIFPPENWAEGFHELSNGKRIRLKKMDDQHLNNLINFYRDQLDVSDLEKEVERREKIIAKHFKI